MRDDVISCKLFPDTMRGVVMQWFSDLPLRTIRIFNDLAVGFASVSWDWPEMSGVNSTMPMNTQ
ncbi:hypothetical protein CR513_57463, partial [Mucuna pruriens]